MHFFCFISLNVDFTGVVSTARECRDVYGEIYVEMGAPTNLATRVVIELCCGENRSSIAVEDEINVPIALSAFRDKIKHKSEPFMNIHTGSSLAKMGKT